MRVAGEAGLLFRSASNVLTDDDVRAIRTRVKIGGQVPEASNSRHGALSLRRVGRRAQRERPKRWYGEIAPLTRLMLDAVLLPQRGALPGEAPWVEEVERADRMAAEWASYFFDDKEARPWVELHHGSVPPSTARALTSAGLTAEEAAERVWYGKRHRSRPSLAQRVRLGDLTPEEARDELSRALAGDPTV